MAQAQAALRRLGSHREDNSQPLLKRAPRFSDHVEQYLAYYAQVKDAKRPTTMESEALRIKWSDVDWEQRQLTIGSDGLAKNHHARVVDFNTRLRQHLLDMRRGRAPDSQWVFPPPQRGDQDRCARIFRESLLLARKEAGVPGFGFHDCRHFFISMCVMSGIDYMTIARWVGHQDGGVLIGKVDGHLSNETLSGRPGKFLLPNQLNRCPPRTNSTETEADQGP